MKPKPLWAITTEREERCFLPVTENSKAKASYSQDLIDNCVKPSWKCTEIDYGEKYLLLNYMLVCACSGVGNLF